MFRTSRISGGAAALVALGMMAMPAAAQDADAEEAATNNILPAALANGVFMDQGDGLIMHEINANGIYYLDGTPSGGWVFRKGELCLVTIPGDVTCTAVPANVAPGASWEEDMGDGQTVSFIVPEAAPEGEDASE